MAVFKAMLVFMTTLLGITLAAPTGSSTSGQVSCATASPAAPTGELYTAVYDFCANLFPREQLLQGTTVKTNYTLPSGPTASVSALLDLAGGDFTPSDCLYFMGKVIDNCAANNQSTGGSWNPSGTAASTFSVQLYAPAISARSDDQFNATESTQRKFDTMCRGHPWDSGVPSIDAVSARNVAAYNCDNVFANAVLAKGEFKTSSYGTVPRLYGNVAAQESLLVTAEDCNWAMDTLFKACAWDGLYYGGEIVYNSAIWVWEFSPAANFPSSERESQLSKRQEAAPQDLDGMNTCYIDGRSGTSYDNAASLVRDIICPSVAATVWPWGVGWQKFFILADGQPLLLTFETFNDADLGLDGCIQAFGGLVTECTSEGIFYGGVRDRDGYIWALEITHPEDAGNERAAIAAAADTDGTKAFVHDKRDSPYDATSECLPSYGPTVDWTAALTASVQYCRLYNGVSLTAGQIEIKLYPTSNQIGQEWIVVEVKPDHDTVMDYSTCFELLGAVIGDCGQGGQTPGGSLTWGGFYARYQPTYVPGFVKTVGNGTADSEEETGAADSPKTAQIASRDSPYGT